MLWKETTRIQAEKLLSQPGAEQLQRGIGEEVGEVRGIEGRREEGERLWEKVEAVVVDRQERRLAYLQFYCGFNAQEIVGCCREEFSDIQEVYRVRAAMFEHLLAHEEIFFEMEQKRIF